MAELVIAAAGAAIGGAVAPGIVAFGMTGASIGWAAGSMLGSAIFNKGQNQQGPRLGDLRVAGTQYGETIPWVAGSPRIAGQIAWASNRREIANTQKVGKGGGGQRVTTYTYEVDLLIVLTENPIVGVTRIWSNGELIYNGVAKSGVWASLSIYTGADDQMPDPIYEAAVGAGNAPAYRGRGYVVIRSLQLGQGGQIPNLTFEIGEYFVNRIVDVETSFVTDITGQGTRQYGPGFSSVANSKFISLIRTDYPGSGTPTRVLSQVTFNIETGATSVDSTWTYVQAFTVANQGRPVVRFLSDELRIILAGNTTGSYAYYPNQTDGTLLVNPGITSTINPGCGCQNEGDIYLGSNSTPVIYRFSKNGGSVLNTYFPASINNGEIFWITANGPLVYVSYSRLGLSRIDILDRSLSLLRTITRPDANLFPYMYPVGNTIILYSASGFFQLNSDDTWTGIGPSPSINYATFFSTVTPTYFGGSITITGGFRHTALRYRVTETGTIVLQTPEVNKVVEDLMDRAGYQTDDYQIDDDSDYKLLRGFAIGQITNTRSSLEVLQKAWYFEASKSDKIYVRPRPVTPIVTIPYDDLGVGEDAGSGNEPLALQIGSDIEVPGQVALSYHNTTADYNITTEYSDRLISSQESTATIQMPLGMTPEEAKGVVDALLMDQVAGLTSTTIRVPLKYAYIEPGDVINAVNFDARTYRLRVKTKRDTLSIIELECVLDDVGALESAAITSGGYISITDPARIAPTVFEAMDIPILRDADNEPGYYAAVAADRTSALDQWPGAVFVQSFGGDAFQQEFVTGESAVMGDAVTVLPDWTGGNVFDEISQVEVEVLGELTSSTRTSMLNDLTINVMLIGTEIIRYRVATLLSSVNGRNTYRLSGLLRGQRGTEWAQVGHGSDEKVVKLDNTIRRVTGLLTQINLERDVKGVTLNTLLSDVANLPFTDTAIGLKPFSVANLRAVANGTDLEVSWQRRTRLSVRYGGAVDQVVPLGEVSENYRVQIYNGTTLVRTETVTQPSYTYAAADIASDGFTTGDPVTVVVAQLSAVVGAGYESETIGVAP